MADRNKVSINLGVFSILGIAFVILRLAEVIKWSWIWVLSPFWMPLAVVILVVIVFYVGKGLLQMFARKRNPTKKNKEV